MKLNSIQLNMHFKVCGAVQATQAAVQELQAYVSLILDKMHLS